jgi:hypothetical protein
VVSRSLKNLAPGKQAGSTFKGCRMFSTEPVSHFGIDKEAQNHACDIFQRPVQLVLHAVSQQPLYDLQDHLPAPFRPPLCGNKMQQLFRLSFLNACTFNASLKSLHEHPKALVDSGRGLTYIGRDKEYYFYSASNPLKTMIDLPIPIEHETIFVAVGAPLTLGELPSQGFKVQRNGEIDKFYFGDFERRFYEINFLGSKHSSVGVKSSFIESSHGRTYFTTRTLSYVMPPQL